MTAEVWIEEKLGMLPVALEKGEMKVLGRSEEDCKRRRRRAGYEPSGNE